MIRTARLDCTRAKVDGIDESISPIAATGTITGHITKT